MSQNVFNRPKFEFHDLTGVTDPDELQTKLRSAFAAYRRFLANDVPSAQQQWARQLLENGDASRTQLAQAKYIIANPDVVFAPYPLSSGYRDKVDIFLPTLFSYMSKERMDAHVQYNGVRVSYGAQLADQTQHVKPPTGVYATTIEPYALDVGTTMMGRHFFEIENSLAAPDDSRAIDTSYFVSFCATSGFSARGRLKFHYFEGFYRNFNHFALSTPGHDVGDYIRIDIVAIGRTLIPETGMRWGYP